MVTRNQKSARDIQEIKRKESKHNTIESNQHKSGKSRRIREEQRTTKSENSKIAITTYLSINILKVNGLNALIKTHRMTEWIKKKIRPVHMLSTRDPL